MLIGLILGRPPQKIIFPWTSRNWERLPATESGARHSAPADGSGTAFAAPSNDENAPDLYIPLMAVITFVLVTGLLKGAVNSGQDSSHE